MPGRHGAGVGALDVAVRSGSECGRARPYGQRVGECALVSGTHVFTVTARLGTHRPLLAHDAAVGARARSEVVAISPTHDDSVRRTSRGVDGTAAAFGLARLPAWRGCAAFATQGALSVRPLARSGQQRDDAQSQCSSRPATHCTTGFSLAAGFDSSTTMALANAATREPARLSETCPSRRRRTTGQVDCWGSLDGEWGFVFARPQPTI